ncbi:MAG: response regulator [Alphaproteobacteria bacterium]|nr:response regulator [Alphaproteobacteria bacterium]MBV9370997.1 response regulator [Alphaproteobacteria bacterium]MBV9899540.1 response regulator [Alphaproteobacteria bacterium]
MSPAAASPAVLVVEDEPLIRSLAAESLADAGIPAIEAEDSEQALALLGRHPEIRLVFTDVNMPGEMDGLRLVQRVHEIRPEVELIVTSGRRPIAERDIPDDGTFLAKPYGLRQLVDTVRRKLGLAARHGGR